MARTAHLEARLAILEDEVAHLKETLGQFEEHTQPWWERITGQFAQDRLYKTAMTLGKRYRQASRPARPE